MGLIETIEKKRKEVMSKQKATGEGNLAGLQRVADDIAKKRKEASMRPMGKFNAK
jgi:hypothetical protein